MKKKNLDYYQISMFLFLTGLFLYEILRLGGSPGIYHDAIMADYTSALAINEQKYSFSHFPFVENVMFFGAFYHGNLQMFWTLFVSLFTGTTSVVQYRIGISFWAIAIIGCIQYYLYKLGVKRIISFLSLLALVICPSFVSLIFTHDYAFLPGTLFMILHLIFLKKSSEENDDKYTYLAGFFIGIAVYSYIIYLLYGFIFSILILGGRNGGTFKHRIERVAVSIHGIFAGVYLYIVGFFSLMFAFRIENETKRNIIFLVFCSLLALYNLFVFFICAGGKRRILLILLLLSDGFIALFSFFMIMMIPSFKTHFFSRGGASVWTSELSIKNRIANILDCVFTTFQNASHERYVLGYTTSKGASLWLFLFLGCSVIWMLLTLITFIQKKRCERNTNNIIVLGIYEIGFVLLMLLVFPGGAHYGHFTTMHVLSFLIVAIIVNDLWNNYSHYDRSFGIIRCVSICLFIVSISVNYFNSGVLATNIITTGGHGYFTSSLTDFANEAKERGSRGERVMYLFPEWGVFPSFMYLTGNSIPFRNSFAIDGSNDEYIISLWEEGFSSMELAYFKQENDDAYMDFMQRCGENARKRIWYTKDGEYAFTTIEITPR